jgi:CHAT domain-containing protein/tetratricopeptide (TPR) repeat protein
MCGSIALLARAQSAAPEPLALTLRAGAVGTLRVPADAGDYVSVLVEQSGDVIITVFSPAGDVLAERNRVEPLDRPERVSWIADATGAYRVALRPRSSTLSDRPHRMALAERRAARPGDDHRVEAERAQQAGDNLRRLGTAAASQQAIELYDRSLESCRAAVDRQCEADALLSLGLTYRSLNDDQMALAFYTQSLESRLAVVDRAGEAFTYQSMAHLFRTTGEPERARAYYTRALTLARATGDRRAEADGLNGLGRLSYELGEMQAALDYHALALPMTRTLGDQRGEAFALNNTGVVHWAMGDLAPALDYFSQALVIRRALGNRLGEAGSLSNMGMVYLEQGDPTRALATHERALAIARPAGDLRTQGLILQEIGRTRHIQGDQAAAAAVLGTSIALCETVGDEFCVRGSLEYLARVESARGRYTPAREHVARAISLSRSQFDTTAEAQALVVSASLEERAGALDVARDRVEAALAVIEAQRSKVLSPDLRASYLASTRVAYELHIDLLMRQHASAPGANYAALALRASERARARSLLDTLAEVRANIREGVDPALLERERAVRQQLNAAADRLTTLAATERPRGERELDALIIRHRELETEIRARSPRYADLTQPGTLDLQAIQRHLGEDDALLEFALGDRRSYAWIVTTRTLTAYELPGRAVIEGAALRAYDALQQAQRPGMRMTAQRAASELAQLLFGGAGTGLSTKRLIVVADGALQFVPFAALPSPWSAAGEPLVEDHEIVMLPSASALDGMRAADPERRPAERALAILADPVFSAADPRVPRAASALPRNVGRRPDRELVRSASDTGTGTFQRLRFTADEARRIAAIAPPAGTVVVLGFDASRERALARDLQRYRFVHFATHALVNTRHPELSGIVLSLVSPEGNGQEGFLRLTDIYNLRLGADLVVLSACQTALGRDVRGEGLIGLTRGFMYAGARAVVSSLWDVRDEQTSELMTRFYRGMLRDGLRPAAALRAAQRSMLDDPAWAAPVHWAGFVLQGEWR